MAPLLAERVAVAAADAYTTYLLLGVILFAAKVGQDAADIGHASRKWMPAGGHPEPAAKLVCCDESLGLSATLQDCVLPYFAWNVPLAAVFVIQHTVLKRSLQRWFGDHGRRVYSLTSALALHFFMAYYRDLDIPRLSLDLTGLGVTSAVHFWASSVVIVVSYLVFLNYDSSSWFRTIVFGAKATKPVAKGGCPVNMDVITGMGICVYKEIGWLGFLLFSGLSIIPRQITLGDVIMRVCSGAYLRRMSGHFKRVAPNYRSHWCARTVVIAAAAIATAGKDFWASLHFWQLVAVALLSTAVIVFFEGGLFGAKRRAKAAAEEAAKGA